MRSAPSAHASRASSWFFSTGEIGITAAAVTQQQGSTIGSVCYEEERSIITRQPAGRFPTVRPSIALAVPMEVKPALNGDAIVDAPNGDDPKTLRHAAGTYKSINLYAYVQSYGFLPEFFSMV